MRIFTSTAITVLFFLFSANSFAQASEKKFVIKQSELPKALDNTGSQSLGKIAKINDAEPQNPDTNAVKPNITTSNNGEKVSERKPAKINKSQEKYIEDKTAAAKKELEAEKQKLQQVENVFYKQKDKAKIAEKRKVRDEVKARLEAIEQEKEKVRQEQKEMQTKLAEVREKENERGLVRWKSYVETSGSASTTGRKIGMADAFLIVKENSNSIVFADVRGQLDNNNSNEYNLGLGYRHLFEENIVGGYVYYDRRSSSNDNIFNQITLGAESLGINWDFRGNIYIPENKEEQVDANVFVKDNKLQASYSTEKALKGADFEVGRKIPLGNTRAFIGGYYFPEDSGSGLTYETVSGARARLESKFFHDHLTLGGDTTYNQDSDIDASAYLRFRLPFGKINVGRKLTPLEQRMTDTVIRDVDIITNKFEGVTSDVTIRANGVTPDNVQFIDLSAISGVNIDDTIEANTSSNALIILSGTGMIDNSIALGTYGQTLMSGNNALSVSYKDAGGKTYSAYYQPNLAPAVIQNNGNVVDMVTINASNVALEGIKFTGKHSGGNTAADAIQINSNLASNVTIKNVVIDDVINGITISGGNITSESLINISDVKISNTTRHAILIGSADNDKVEITNFTTNNLGTAFYGVAVDSATNGASVKLKNYQHSGTGNRTLDSTTDRALKEE